MNDDEPPIRTLHSKRKHCTCGNHHGGAKSNRHHHATRVKLARRRIRSRR